MEEIKTKAIKNIERRMEETGDKMRHDVLEKAKCFKTSWIDLGQALYTVWNDKLYKNWGYTTFDIYTAKEIGIRKNTAMKLLKSYYFLEKKEPGFLKAPRDKNALAASLPSYEAVDALRLASKRKDISEDDYERIKTNVLEKGRDSKDVRKDLAEIIKKREELEPVAQRRKKKIAVLRRFVGTLKALKEEIKISKMISAGLVKEIDKLMNNIESEINEEGL